MDNTCLNNLEVLVVAYVLGLLQRNVFCDWPAFKGIMHTPAQLHLLRLSPCATRNAPWAAHSVKALSNLNKLRSGQAVCWQDIASAPLWNSCVFTVDNKAITCRYLIARSILRVHELVNSESWTVCLLQSYYGSHKLEPAV